MSIQGSGKPSPSNQELTRCLYKIQRVFDVDSVINQSINAKFVVDYYTQSQLGYHFFHSPEGAVHLALNFVGQHDKERFYGQAKLVQEHIHQLQPKQVLELGSGQGFNAIYLAQRNPTVQFAGVDLTPAHVAVARRKSKEINNLAFVVGDFQALPFRSHTYNLAFEVESVCHAANMSQALAEACRVLRPGGRFLVFDGFRKLELDQVGTELQTAARLVERALAVDQFWVRDRWLELAKSVGLCVLEVQDLSEAILPNLMRLQWLARGYFKFSILARGIQGVLPPLLVKNSIAGLLFPFTIRAGVHGYYGVVLGHE